MSSLQVKVLSSKPGCFAAAETVGPQETAWNHQAWGWRIECEEEITLKMRENSRPHTH